MIPYIVQELSEEGSCIFKKGDKADKIYFIQSGEIKLTDLDKVLPQGMVLGKVGIFTPENQRTAVCMANCNIYSIHRDKVLELYY